MTDEQIVDKLLEEYARSMPGGDLTLPKRYSDDELLMWRTAIRSSAVALGVYDQFCRRIESQKYG